MYIFSPSTNAFFPMDLKAEIEANGVWPSDGIEIDDSVFHELSQSAPAGKMKVIVNGQLPTFIDIPETLEE